ncbi:MAG: neutral/alkaline non-lysosomal ceramidase N-terminal domain-containing protein [Bryobacteraceae bacterium]
MILKKKMIWAPAILAVLLAASAPAKAQSLRVGAARVDITPAANPANPPSGKYTHERLYLRAIVLDNGATRAALIGADQSMLFENVWSAASKQIAAELNCPVENIILSVTHTHSAWGPGDQPFRRFGQAGGPGGPPPAPDPNAPPPPIVGQILDAVKQAKANLQPARVGFGTGFSYLNVSRDNIDTETHLWTQAPNLNGASDKTVAVLKFESLSGEMIATYFTYAMHPVNGFLTDIVSADFCGAASRHIEQAYGDKTVAVFAQNASGDQNPLYLRASTNVMAARSGLPVTGNVMTREKIEAPLRDGKVKPVKPDPQVVDALEKVMESKGVLLGEEAIRAMSNTTRLDPAPAISGAQTTITCPGRRRLDNAREGTPGKYEDGEPVQIRLGVIRIGNIAIASANAEIYSAIGLKFKAASPLANTMFVTIANGRANSGYVPNDAAFGAYTFQVLGSRLKPGCAEDAIVNGLVGLIQPGAK